MARLLVVEDDADQRELRRLLFERAGHEVEIASAAREAERAVAGRAPSLVVMDLRLPRTEDGLALIRRLRELSPALRIVVLSGFPADVNERPEAELVAAVVPKPCRSAKLLEIVSRLVVLILCVAAAARPETLAFRVARPGEVIARIEMSSPGADWAREGREAALATLAVDGRAGQHVMLYAGAARYAYRVFLGALAAGEHKLAVQRDARWSAAGAGLEVAGVSFEEAGGDPVVAHSPVLLARSNTVGKFSDVPMIVYAERLRDQERPFLQYTVIFSNEDGGTSTRALMARWGRTTDIEYVYRVWLDPAGRAARATIQGKDHKEVEFRGSRDGSHPVLMPITDNNMIGPGWASPIRYRIAPVEADLAAGSREVVMDRDPVAYRVTAQELEREGKLRPFGAVDGEKISDPRNYLYIEARIVNRDSRSAFLVRLQGERRWRVAHLGKPELAIERDGWVRSAVELPPGTTPARIAELGFECLTREKRSAGACRIEEISKLFFLDRDYRPGPPFGSRKPAADVPSGEILTWSFESK